MPWLRGGGMDVRRPVRSSRQMWPRTRPKRRRRYAMCGRKWTARLSVLLISSSVMSGCARTELVAEPSFCAVSGPIRIGSEDVLTDQTARLILNHNLTGKQLCGWKGKK